jgi:ABC-type lipoprotein release transport system permease subunit
MVAAFFSNGVLFIVTYSTWISQMPFVVLSDVISLPLRIGLWVIFWGYWFRIVFDPVTLAATTAFIAMMVLLAAALPARSAAAVESMQALRTE